MAQTEFLEIHHHLRHSEQINLFSPSMAYDASCRSPTVRLFDYIHRSMFLIAMDD